ncbi:MAG TPA: OmpH family outer membrane protein [Lacunisphaera sp.]|nr:OmpH family outer membrane protein [Lacunisphaera sp.]
MKKSLRSIVTLAALAAATSLLQAQPAVKLVVVDVAKAFESHWESEEANAKIQESKKKAEEQTEEMGKQRQLIVDSYKELVEQAKNTLLTAEARTKAEGEVQKKYEELQRKTAEIQNFIQNTQRILQQRIDNHRELLLDKINKLVVEIAKRHGATLVLDKSGPSIYKIPVVLYSDAAFDITEELVKEENKDRPAPAAPTTAPAGTTQPAPGALPAPKVATPEPKK